MIQTVNFSEFDSAFRACNRSDQFSYQGLNALYDYLEETDPDYDLDVIALCCDYSEDTWQSIAQQYNIEYDENENEDEGREAVLTYLRENTSLIAELGRSFLYANF
jgi:hypothetical protein